MSEQTTRITLRLPNDIAATAKVAAEREGVSLNEFIVAAVVSHSGHRSEIERRLERLESEVALLRGRS